MKKIILLLISSIFVIGVLSAQDTYAPEKKGFDKSKLFFGGNFGLGFGSYSTAINISPQIGYHFSPLFAAGAGINYAYYSYKYYTYNNNNIYEKTSYSYAGLNVFGRVYPIPYLFIQAQPELNYIWGKQKYYDGTPDYKIPSQFVPSLLMGGGAAIPAGRGAITISILYDVIQNNLSPYYRQPLYGFGFNVGF